MIHFSIIIPVYNSAKYITHCFNSIINQNYAHLQIIFVDDGSTDNSFEILESFKEKHNNISIIFQENAGPGVARNTGLKFAEGEYVWFIDADDRIAPQSFIGLSAIFEKNMPEILCINYSQTKTDCSEMFTPDFSNDTIKISNKIAIINESPAIWKKIYKQSFLKENNCKFPPYYFGEDLAEVYRLFASAKNIYKTDAILYYYYLNVQSLSFIFKPRYFSDFLNVLEILKNISNSFLQNYDELRYIAYMHAKIILDTYKKYKYDDAENSIEIIQKYIEQLNLNTNVFYLLRKSIEDKYECSKSWKVAKPLREIRRFLNILKMNYKIKKNNSK